MACLQNAAAWENFTVVAKKTKKEREEKLERKLSFFSRPAVHKKAHECFSITFHVSYTHVLLLPPRRRRHTDEFLFLLLLPQLFLFTLDSRYKGYLCIFMTSALARRRLDRNYRTDAQFIIYLHSLHLKQERANFKLFPFTFFLCAACMCVSVCKFQKVFDFNSILFLLKLFHFQISSSF